MKVDVFLEGGGIWGLSYLGVYKALSDYGITIERICGISVGSLIGSLISFGFTPNELVDLLDYYPDFTFLKQKTKTAHRHIVGKPLSILFNRGIYDSETIEQFISEISEKRGISTFRPLFHLGESRLKIIACDYTKKKVIVLPDDLPQYGYEKESFSVAKAVRMSCAIPFYFTPYTLQTSQGVNYIVDSGFIKTIPTAIMYEDRKLKRLTLRFTFKRDKSRVGRFFDDIASPFIPKRQIEDWEREIVINTDRKVRMTNFDISKDQLIGLYKAGYRACRDFIRTEIRV